MALVEPLIHFPTLTIAEEVLTLESELADQCWEEAKRVHGDHLFNGRLLVLERQEGDHFFCRYMEYRRFLTECRYPEKRAGHLALGVQGVTCYQGRVLFAKRAPWVAFYPGCYEMAPAGNLSSPEIVAHLLEELVEETGQRMVEVISPLCLIKSDDLPVIDICARIDLCMLEPLRGEEYSDYKWIDILEPLNLEPLVPSAKALLEFVRERWKS